MKRNKLKIDAFEKYCLTNTSKISIKGGYPDGWTPELGLEEGGDPTGDDGGPPKNGGPVISTTTGGMTIKIDDPIIVVVKFP